MIPNFKFEDVYENDFPNNNYNISSPNNNDNISSNESINTLFINQNWASCLADYEVENSFDCTLNTNCSGVDDTILKTASEKMKNIITRCHSKADGGTIGDSVLTTLNDASKIEFAVGGVEIFQMIAREIEKAEDEVLIQTFAWESDLPVIEWLYNSLTKTIERKNLEENPKPLKVYVLIDERGPIGHYAFTGKKFQEWPTTPKSIGLEFDSPSIEVYVDTYRHNTMKGNHAKTVVIDSKTLVITGANIQSSNFGFLPAHDGAICMKGAVAKAAREDFDSMWEKRNSRSVGSNLDNLHYDENLENIIDPIPVIFATRQPKKVKRLNPFTNPQNEAFHQSLLSAESSIKIVTPNINAPFILNDIVNFIMNKEGRVELLLGKGFNAKRESVFGMGGTNQYAVNYLYSKIPDDYHDLLDIKWYSRDGIEPLVGNVAGASHMKLMVADNVVVFGNANLDESSLMHLHEANIVFEDETIASQLLEKMFYPAFENAIKALPATNTMDKVFDWMGVNGAKNILGNTYRLEIRNIIDKPQGYKTFQLEKPSNFRFTPGQYVEVRSDKKMSRLLKKPLEVVITSSVYDDYLEFTARPSALLTDPKHCLKKNVGDVLNVVGPIGSFFPIELVGSEKFVYLIGGGSGITALRSVYRSLECPEKSQIIYSTKSRDSMIYEEELKQLSVGRHIISLTQEDYYQYASGRVNEHIKSLKLIDGALFFVCGPVPLIEAVVGELKMIDIIEENIYVSMPTNAISGGPVYQASDSRVKRYFKDGSN